MGRQSCLAMFMLAHLVAGHLRGKSPDGKPSVLAFPKVESASGAKPPAAALTQLRQSESKSNQDRIQLAENLDGESDSDVDNKHDSSNDDHITNDDEDATDEEAEEDDHESDDFDAGRRTEEEFGSSDVGSFVELRTNKTNMLETAALTQTMRNGINKSVLDPGDLADSELDSIQLAESLDEDDRNGHKDTENRHDISDEEEFDAAMEAEEGIPSEDNRQAIETDADDADTDALVQLKSNVTKSSLARTFAQLKRHGANRSGMDPGDLADSELDRIQLAENLDEDDSTGHKHSEGYTMSDEEEFDAAMEAEEGIPSEDTQQMVDTDVDADTDSFVQLRNATHVSNVKTFVQLKRHGTNRSGTDPGDLADSELDRIQLAENLDEDASTMQKDSKDSHDMSDEEEFDAAMESEEGIPSEDTRQASETDADDADTDAFVQLKNATDVSNANTFVQLKRHATNSSGMDPGDLADSEVDRIQLAENLDEDDSKMHKDSEGGGMSDEEEFDAVMESEEGIPSDDARETVETDAGDADTDSFVQLKRNTTNSSLARTFVQWRNGDSKSTMEPEDLADGESEQPRLADEPETHTENNHGSSGESQDMSDEEEFDAATSQDGVASEGTQQTVEPNVDDADAGAFIQMRHATNLSSTGTFIQLRRLRTNKSSMDPGDLADGELERIQLADDLSDNDDRHVDLAESVESVESQESDEEELNAVHVAEEDFGSDDTRQTVETDAEDADDSQESNSDEDDFDADRRTREEFGSSE